MFSWICKHCGRDNPPSAVRCLSCGIAYNDESAPETPEPPEVEDAAYLSNETAYEGEEADVEQEAVPPSPPPPVRRAPPAAVPPSPSRATAMRSPAAPARPAAPRAPDAPPPQTRSGMPTWLLTILCFLAIVGAGFGIYYAITSFENHKATAKSPGTGAATTAAAVRGSNPLQKVVEVVGIRMFQDAHKHPEVRFVVVNHSPDSLDPLSAAVTLWASTSRSEEDSVGTFTFKAPALGPYESKELSAPLTTKLKIYELPDWQNATAELQITTP